MPDVLTGERALELLREVVAERPDYVYDGPDPLFCLYVHADADGGLECGCVVAHVLHRHGVELAELLPQNSAPVVQLPAEWMDITARRLLFYAQLAQDSAKPWSEALAAAEKFARASGVTTT